MRRPAQAPQRARKAQVVSFPPPTAGWISNQNLIANTSNTPGAVVLDNFWPTPQTVRIRRGCALYSQPSSAADCSSLMAYDNGSAQKLFACIGGSIWDVTSADEPEEVVSGLIGGEWSYTQFATDGGVFLIAVNGADPMQLYDGTRWWSITGANVLQLLAGTITKAPVKGEVVTGGTSGATGTVTYLSGSQIYVTTTDGKTFTSGETVTGNDGASFTLSADSQVWWTGITPKSGSSIDAIETSQFSFVWSYMSRLYFVQRDSMNFWYLEVGTVGGDALPYPMGAIFPDGGALLFGSSWSLDNSSSNGLSEQCVFVTDAGEVAVYRGIDPNLSDTWGKVGLYRVDKPRGKRAFIRNGGDLLIATDAGLIPLTQAVERNPSNLAPGAVSYPVQDAWMQYVSERPDRNWQMVVWPEMQMVAVSIPAANGYEPYLLVVNMNTSSWARFTNWNALCFATFGGQLYFGTTAGRVAAAWQTGFDMDAPFTAIYAPLFHDLGGTFGAKMPRDASVMMRGSYDVTWSVSMMYDYVPTIPAAPAAAQVTNDGVWAEGIWNQSLWGQSTDMRPQKKWSPVAGMGYAISPCLQITSGNLLPFDNEIVRVDVTYLVGGLLS
ncbi:hypothetical protein [Acetobacter cerevisiae]|uniref:hypothetical protein n=1 Tax=Acetobacter cerevisiae TaxID=178900 RepID=UPI00209DDC6F|nr:hypothetical protein [Acetobacter cerevisiae]MCP1270563.1 hypothetical protein [Acetobacter cerevisiae]MCP1278517.1 hypothetical protein [Acetobacter cerevisiae]